MKLKHLDNPQLLGKLNHAIDEKPSLVMETDASTTGWGATCEGVWTGGPWSETESHLHINCLELLPATLAVKHHCNSLHQQTGWSSVPRTESSRDKENIVNHPETKKFL